jgi:hypothetical protein
MTFREVGREEFNVDFVDAVTLHNSVFNPVPKDSESVNIASGVSAVVTVDPL